MAAVADATETPKNDQPDPSQLDTGDPDEMKQALTDTMAEQQALAALDELIQKFDAGQELSGSASRPAPEAPAAQTPREAYAITSDVPPLEGWYVAMKDNAQGPLTVDQLKDLWSDGEIGADTLCWREGMGEWRPFSKLHGLAAAIAPRPREGLKALSQSAKPITRTISQPGFAPNASNMLRSLAEQEAKSTPTPPPTAPTMASGPRRAQQQPQPPPPAVKPPPPSMDLQELRALADEVEDLRKARLAGLTGGKLFLSLLAASVLGGVAGGALVKMTLPPPPERVAIRETAPDAPAPPPAHAAEPPAPASAPAKTEAAPVRAEVKPPEDAAKAPPVPKKTANPSPPPPSPPPPPPKTQLDKDFQDTFGK